MCRPGLAPDFESHPFHLVPHFIAQSGLVRLTERQLAGPCSRISPASCSVALFGRNFAIHHPFSFSHQLYHLAQPHFHHHPGSTQTPLLTSASAIEVGKPCPFPFRKAACASCCSFSLVSSAQPRQKIIVASPGACFYLTSAHNVWQPYLPFPEHSLNRIKHTHNSTIMATTAMDYENANGDRFEGQFILSSKPQASATCN